MESFRAGDQHGLEHLYIRHAGGLETFLRTLVKDGALAQDLVHTTFVSVMRSVNRFERGAKVAPWLFAIARNAALDSLRRKKSSSSQDVEQQAAEPATSEDTGLRMRLQEALEALPASQREVVVLHKVEGLSFDEISTALNITPTAARLRAHRGYERLRELLQETEVA